MNIIKKIRTENKLSQTKFAELLNVHQTAVSQWENGRTAPDITSAKLISQKFGVSLDILLGGLDNDADSHSLNNINKNDNKVALDEQLDGIDFALFGEVKDMTDKQKQDVLNFAKFIKNTNEKSDE